MKNENNIFNGSLIIKEVFKLVHSLCLITTD